MGGCVPCDEREDEIEWTRNSIETQSLNTMKKKSMKTLSLIMSHSCAKIVFNWMTKQPWEKWKIGSKKDFVYAM